MNSSNPKTINGKVYDKYSLNLAINGMYKEDGTPDANIAMRLIPTRVENGVVEKVDEQSIPVYLGTIVGADEATQLAVAKVQQALQEFIQLKGL
jgi:hypothetical protein